MNFLQIGLGEKSFKPKPGFLFIHDEVPTLRATVFDPTVHSFNPLKGMDYKGAREFADTVFGEEGKDTLTVRNGKRSLTRLLLTTTRLDHLEALKGDEEAEAMVDDLLLSPVLRKVLCSPTNFSLKSTKSIVARINRAELGEVPSGMWLEFGVARSPVT